MKVSFDYDGTLSTRKGKDKAIEEKKNGNTLYLISARSKAGLQLYKDCQEVGINKDKIYLTGSNEKKIEKIKELGIERHYDNNRDVINKLGSIGKLI